MELTLFLSPKYYLFILFVTCFFSIKLLAFFIPNLDSYIHPTNSWIDGLRGLAATFVVINHASLLTALQLSGTHGIQKLASWGPFLGSIGVQLFFCITGMLFIHKISSGKNIHWIDFYRKRIRRIVPAYLVICSIVCVVALIYSWPIKEPLKNILGAMPSIFSFGFMPAPHINTIDFGYLLGVNWTLAMEWRFYLLLPILMIFFEKWPRIFVAFIILFALGDLIIYQKSSWVYFISGAISAPLMSRQFSKGQRQLGVLIMVLVLVMYALFWNKCAAYGLGRWVLMSVLFAAISIARPTMLHCKPLMHLGLISYSFYLMHCTVLFAAFYAPTHHAYPISSSTISMYLIKMSTSLAIAVMCACFSYLYVERRFMFPNEKIKSFWLKPANYQQPLVD